MLIMLFHGAKIQHYTPSCQVFLTFYNEKACLCYEMLDFAYLMNFVLQ